MKSLPRGTTGSLLFATSGSGSAQQTAGKLNLVSLMDIFTILVFFLMVNTGDVEVLQPDEHIVLPKSYASLKPDSVPVVKVSNDMIYFNQETISSSAVIAKKADVIKELLLALNKYQSDNKSSVNEEAQPLAISVMADANVPYALIKKVLYTSAEAGYVDVALAVEHSTRALNSASVES